MYIDSDHSATATDKYGFNRHVWDNPPRNYIPQRKLVMAIELLFVTSTGLIKLSVLLFYRRIVDRSISKRFIVINWISIGFVVAYIIAYVGLVFAACRPFSAFWDQLNLSKLAAGYKYECVDEGFHLLSATIISCVQDFIATTVPACLWWKITLPVRQKLALAAVFAIGYIVCLIATLRCYYIWKIFYDTWDVTWWTWPSWLLTIMEALVAAMCASAPALKVVLHRFFGSTIASASSSFGNTPRNWKDIKAWVTPRSHSGYANQSKDRSQTLELSSRSQIVMQKEITIVSTTDLNEYPADIEGQRRNSPTQFDMYPMRHPSY